MTKEEVLTKLKEMFPEGIPNAAGEIMSHIDAPFLSYAELRKIVDVTVAKTNRYAFKLLLEDIDNSVPEEPESPTEPEETEEQTEVVKEPKE